MATCVGCGEPLAPAWKFCIHCGIAVGDPQPVATGGAPAPRVRLSRGLTVTIVAFAVVGVGLIALAIAFISGAFGRS